MAVYNAHKMCDTAKPRKCPIGRCTKINPNKVCYTAEAAKCPAERTMGCTKINLSDFLHFHFVEIETPIP